MRHERDAAVTRGALCSTSQRDVKPYIYQENNYGSPNEALKHRKARDVEYQRLHSLHRQLVDSS